jgi:hypothetical protein
MARISAALTMAGARMPDGPVEPAGMVEAMPRSHGTCTPVLSALTLWGTTGAAPP